jgi:hypothetical protein
LLQNLCSVRAVQQTDAAALGAVLTKSQTEAVLRHFQGPDAHVDAGQWQYRSSCQDRGCRRVTR